MKRELDNIGLIGLREVCERANLFPSDIDELVKRGELPRPLKLWRWEEISDWLYDNVTPERGQWYSERAEAACYIAGVSAGELPPGNVDLEYCEKLAAERKVWDAEYERQLAQAEAELHPSNPGEEGSYAA